MNARARAALAAALAGVASGCGGGDDFTPPATGQVRLLDVQAQVFTPRCALSGCHVGGSGAPFGLDLSSVASSEANAVGVASNEMPSLLRVDPGDAASSYLFLKITADPSILGDPMPASGGPLSAADIALIETWIDQGAH